MNKKVQKGLVAAVAATMGASVVAPTVFAASQTQNVSLATEYQAAYNATAKATASKDQKELTAARVLVDALYARVHGTADEYLATTLSSILDPVQHVKLVALDEAIKKAEVSIKQADINAARNLIMEMPDVWKRTFSSAIDTIQAKLMANVDTALSKVKASRLQADFDAASLLVDEVLTVTNNAGVKTWADAIKAELDKVDVKLEVTSVTATNANTLTVVGGGLKKLKAEDITMSGNKVTTVTSADGKTATLVLEAKLAPNSTTIVNVKDEAGSKDYEVKFGYVTSKVTVNATTFDDERASQKVTFKINDEAANADLNYLTLSGHTVTFVATDKDGKPANIFKTGTNVSDTGALLPDLRALVGEYNIEVQITRDGLATVSGKATIKIANIDANVTTIDSVRFVNGGTDKSYTSVYATSYQGDDFVMNSTTLVAGEQVGIWRVKSTVEGVSQTVEAGNVEVKSSNSAVISVGANNVLTAEAAGTATITVKVGEVTKTYTFTVKNEARELASVKPEVSKIDMVIQKTKEVTFKTVDQYGDPIGLNNIEEVIPKGTTNGVAIVSGLDVATNLNDADHVYGSYTATVKADDTGSKTIYFKDANGVVRGSLIVNVTAVDNVKTQKLELVQKTNQSTDNTLDFLNAKDNKVTYALSNYNSQGIFAGYQALTDYTVSAVDASVVTVNQNADTIDIVANDILTKTSKSTDVVIKKTATGEIVGRISITVNKAPYKITAVNFTQVSKIDYAGAQIYASDVLDTVASADDDIVNGITLNRATQSKVRLAKTAGAGIAIDELYLDLDNNGKASTGDIKLGVLVASKTTDSTSSISVSTTGANYSENGFFAATKSGDKGTIIIKIMTDATDATTSIAATSITIDVK